MLSSVLQSDRAIEINIAIMRTFTQLRRVRSQSDVFEKKMDQLEARVGKHDASIAMILEALRQIGRDNFGQRKRIKGLSRD